MNAESYIDLISIYTSLIIIISNMRKFANIL